MGSVTEQSPHFEEYPWCVSTLLVYHALIDSNHNTLPYTIVAPIQRPLILKRKKKKQP